MQEGALLAELKIIEPAALKLKYKIIIPHSPLNLPLKGRGWLRMFSQHKLPGIDHKLS